MDPIFYVYLYLDPQTPPIRKDSFSFDCTPFYVGKGCGNRFRDHLLEARRGKDTYLARKIRKILRSGVKPTILIYQEELPEQKAFALERELISSLGRIHYEEGGILVNRTLGGEGVSGYCHTQETRDKISLLHKGRKFTASHCANISRGKKRYVFTDKHRMNLGVSLRSSRRHKQAMSSEEYRKKMSVAVKSSHKFQRGVRSVGRREKLRERYAGIPYEERYGSERSQEIKEKIRGSTDNSGENNPMWGRRHSPETKAKISAAHRGNSNLGGRKGKVFARYVFYLKGVEVITIYGQREAKEFCKSQKIPFGTLCKKSDSWGDWFCERERKK
jgi:hypothetical protein